MIYLIGLLVGLLIVGPALAWLAGMFNPMGFLGVLPWRAPEAARAADRENRIWTPAYHQPYERRPRGCPPPAPPPLTARRPTMATPETIWRFPLEIIDEPTLSMPTGSRVLS